MWNVYLKVMEWLSTALLVQVLFLFLTSELTQGASIYVFDGDKRGPTGALPNNSFVISRPDDGSGFRFRFICQSSLTGVGQIIDTGGNSLKSNSRLNISISQSDQPVEVLVSNRYGSQQPISSVQQGVYTCQLPSLDGTLTDLSIGIYPNYFNREPPRIISLTFDTITRSFNCISTGSPATTVTWTKNGQPLTTDGGSYQLIQRVTNKRASTYENVLTLTTVEEQVITGYVCTVMNALGSTTRIFSVYDTICPILNQPQNGRVVTYTKNRFVGSTASYSCEAAFKLKGAITRECVQSGQWNGDEPTCVRIICPALSQLQDGTVEITNNRYLGSTASYSCNDGFRRQGTSTRQCVQSGQWSGDEPSCVRFCPILDQPQNGRVTYANNQYVGSTASYTCNAGFRMQGASTRQCTQSGLWSGNEPSCIRIMCPILNQPQNARSLTYTNNRYIGATASYSCNDGFRRQGISTRQCIQSGQSGQWSGHEPSCVRICPILNQPQNGRVTYTNNQYVGSTASYTCNAGFRTQGTSTRQCTQSGQWSGSEPSCIRIMCPILNRPQNARSLTYTNNRYIGATASYSCNDGFRRQGNSVRRCIQSGQSGQWNGHEPSCARICPILNPQNGRVTYTNNQYVGSTASYTCNAGFRMQGASTRQCTQSGQWSGSEPSCIRIMCPTLNRPHNARMVTYTNNRYIGATASYSCNDGFRRQGTSVRRCIQSGQSGQWSGHEPSCVRICPILNQPQNGRVTYTNNQYVGSTASYTCNAGFRMQSTSTRQCMQSGQWSGSEPSCIRIMCPTLNRPHNARMVTYTNNRYIGATASYSCNDGFGRQGTSTRRCIQSGQSGQWSGDEPSCIRIMCPILNRPQNAKLITYTNNRYIGSTASYSCNVKFRMQGTSTRQCIQSGQSGRWSGYEPSCVRIMCPILRRPQNARMVTYTNNRYIGSIASYSCNAGFRTEGASARECLQSGQWSGVEPSCLPIECRSLQNPKNGVVNVSEILFKSVATYSCNSSFQLVGQESITCQEDGEWSGEPPECIPLRCPILSNPINGSVVINNNTASYSCNVGFRWKGNHTRQCMQSGQWSGAEPSCASTECTSLLNPKNGTVNLTEKRHKSVATFSCSPSYRLVGQESITCQEDGEWSGEPPECVPLNCSSDVKIEKTNFPPEDANLSLTEYRAASGPFAFTCRLEGATHDTVYQWSSTCDSCPFAMATSASVYRTALLSSDNGIHTCTVLVPNTKCGTASIEMKIVGAGIFVFKAHQTSPIHTLPNNSFIITDSNNYNIRFFFTCRSNSTQTGIGHLIGPDGNQLVSNDHFNITISGNHPANILVSNYPDRQQAITSRQQGVYTCSIPDENGEVININIGIYPSGFSARPYITSLIFDTTTRSFICTSTGSPATTVTWMRDGETLTIDGIGHQLTQRVTNRAASTYENMLTIAESEFYNATYKCKVMNAVGYATAIFSVKACPDLEHPVNGTVSISRRLPGDTASYSCNDGYDTCGNSQTTRTCRDNGQWSGREVVCIIKETDSTSAIVGGAMAGVTVIATSVTVIVVTLVIKHNSNNTKSSASTQEDINERVRWTEVARSSQSSHYEPDNLKKEHGRDLPVQKHITYDLVGHHSQSAVATTEEPTYINAAVITSAGPFHQIR